jgi:hypothetical protein
VPDTEEKVGVFPIEAVAVVVDKAGQLLLALELFQSAIDIGRHKKRSPDFSVGWT